MSKIRNDLEGGVRTITIARAEKRNALDADMLDDLTAIFGTAPGRNERLAVVRSEGGVFCSGLDLRERLEKPSTGTASPIEAMLHAIETYPLPVVAVVQGDAIAGGNELALHCDLVIASETARFGMPLTQLGLAPTWFLAKKILEVGGPVAAREMFLMGDPLPAARMHELGMIFKVVPPGELQVTAQRYIDRIAANAPLSLRATKAVLVREMTYRDSIPHDDVDKLVVAARGSQDAKEGVRARLEKRKPQFKGE